MQFILFGPVICVLAIGLWWLFASRAAWRNSDLGPRELRSFDSGRVVSE